MSLSAALVAAGILLSRISGYIRVTIFSSFFGLGPEADAFNGALRIPNFLQNLLGEGVLSASLIPVYAGLLRREHRAGADQVARHVLAVLAVVTAVFVVVGVTWAPALVSLAVEGYTGATRDLTIQLVRIMFPGIGALVFSAWCIAILNSHHKFFLSYAAPVVWNAAIIAALLMFHTPDLARLAIDLAWAALIGCVLQLAIQLPTVWRLMSFERPPADVQRRAEVARVLRSSVPVIFTRGIVQVSAYIDTYIASWLGSGAVTALLNAQQLNQLPVSLFGMAISSATLPTLAVAVADRMPATLRKGLLEGQQLIVVLVVPSVIAFLGLGDVMIAMLLEHGRFSHENTLYVWSILAGSAVGLLATTVARLYSNGFYALGDTRTPAAFAAIRIVLVAALGYLLAIVVPPRIGIPAPWGAAGLTVSAGFAGWVEFLLLRRSLQQRIGALSIAPALLVKTWAAALAALAAASVLRWVLPAAVTGARHHGVIVLVRGLVMLGTYGTSYLALAQATGLLALNDLARRVLRRSRA